MSMFRLCHILSCHTTEKIYGILTAPLCDQVTDDYTVIGKNLFKKETNLQLFVGLKVTLSSGETGVIEGSFGQSGKIKIRVPGMKRTHTTTQTFLCGSNVVLDCGTGTDK